MYERRRARLREILGPESVFVAFATPAARRNGDVEHDYRAESDILWLTGFDEPECVVVVRNAAEGPSFAMLVRPRDPEREVWDGRREGVEGAQSHFGAEAAWPMAELSTRLAELFVGCGSVHVALGRDAAADQVVLSAIRTARARTRRGGRWPTRVVDPVESLDVLRWRKGPEEIALMERAAEVTAGAYTSLFRATRPGVHEYELEALLRAAFRRSGGAGPAYPPIVASGPNACTLHHVRNDRRMEDGDLLLVDAGAEFGGYACDVTRTFPVSGRFTPAQRALYDVVLGAQRDAIALAAPGATLPALHAAAVRALVTGLVRLGLLDGEVDALIEKEAHKRWYMHSTSHWLGLDVHDVGRYFDDRIPRALEPGVVLTVEPGLYIAPGDETAPPEFRGIGIRIEDDILVEENGHRVLTAAIPKDAAEVERCIGARAGTQDLVAAGAAI